MNKKAMGRGLVILVSVIIIALSLFIFNKYVMLKADKTKQVIKDIHNVDRNIFLINYLRTPINNDMTISDLISLYVLDESYKNKLIDETEKIFSEIFDKNFYWELKINNEVIKGKRNKGNKLIKANTIIPPAYSNSLEPIKVSLTVRVDI